jgi:hypothetical protein
MSHLPNYLFLLIPIASAIAFFSSLTIFFKPAPERYLKYFSFFLFVNLLMDIATDYTAFYHIDNAFLNNISTVLVITFELFLLREIVHGKKAKKVILGFTLAYPLVALINVFLVQNASAFQSRTYAFGCLLIVPSCIYYFWELFQQKSSVNLARQPAFWICSGLLFFYACTFPLYGLLNFVNSLPKIIIQNLFQIYILLNIFLYLSFTIAFLCRLRLRKSM